MSTSGDAYGYGDVSAWSIVAGIFIIILGPILTRIWCEIMIVIFRIHDELKQINYSAWSMQQSASQLLEAGKTTTGGEI